MGRNSNKETTALLSLIKLKINKNTYTPGKWLNIIVQHLHANVNMPVNITNGKTHLRRCPESQVIKKKKKKSIN